VKLKNVNALHLQSLYRVTWWSTIFMRSMVSLSCSVRSSGRVMRIPFAWEAERPAGESGRGSPFRSHFLRFVEPPERVARSRVRFGFLDDVHHSLRRSL
jgi:hypothetical protein